ncbi:hypothetical protein L4C31_01360 [Aliivibrio sifiae]
MKINYVCLLLCFTFSPLYAATSRTLAFPVTTTVNKAELSNYMIKMSLSQDNVVLSYSVSEQKFEDANVFITSQSNIPDKEVLNYQYHYSIAELRSECQDIAGNIVKEDKDFIRLFINGSEYHKGGITPTTDFDGEDAFGFLKREDKLVLRTGKNISKDVPVACIGQVNFKVELTL